MAARHKPTNLGQLKSSRGAQKLQARLRQLELAAALVDPRRPSERVQIWQKATAVALRLGGSQAGGPAR
jgi:hypothetical protein